MKDCRNEYTLDLIQQMYNILVLSMSSRTLSTLLWPFLALSVQVHDKFSHLSCLTPGGRPPWMLWSLMASFAQLVSTESPTAAQER